MFAPKVRTGQQGLRPLARAAVYGVGGCLGELFFTACTSAAAEPPAPAPHQPAGAAHLRTDPAVVRARPRIMRGRVPLWGRALVYGSGFQAAEYLSGRLLRRLLGQAPWDYSAARGQPPIRR